MQVTIFQPGLLNCSELLAPHGSCYIWSSWNITAKLVSFAAFLGGETSVSLFFFLLAQKFQEPSFIISHSNVPKPDVWKGQYEML